MGSERPDCRWQLGKDNNAERQEEDMSLHSLNTLILDIELLTTRCKLTQHWCEVLTHCVYRLYNHQLSDVELFYAVTNSLPQAKPAR